MNIIVNSVSFRIWRETERRYKDLTTLVLVSHSLSSQSSHESTTHCWQKCCQKKEKMSSTSINATSTETPPTSESIYTIVIQLERANCGEHNATVTMITGAETEETPPSPPPTRIRAPIQPKSERKAAKTLSAILLAFIVTWTPYNVLGNYCCVHYIFGTRAKHLNTGFIVIEGKKLVFI